MRLVVANHSSYPRIGESPHDQRLRRAYASRETGETSEEGYRSVVRDYATEILAEQAEAGADVLTDGQVHWYDCISHLAGRLAGTRVGGLVRFFDTNYLIRRPEVVGRLGGRLGLSDDYTFASGAAAKSVKAVLTGPYTLARHSVLLTSDYRDLETLALAYADALAPEVEALAAAGCDVVQVEEPSLLHAPQDARVVESALRRLGAAKGRARISLVTYFGDAGPLYATLLRMPVDMLGFDLEYGPELAERIVREPPDRPVALGVVNGRNTRLEDVDAVARTVDAVASALARRGVDEVHVQASCGLEYLPRDAARRKIECLARIAGRVSS